jgi:hypothetical protein
MFAITYNIKNGATKILENNDLFKTLKLMVDDKEATCD